jgi:hypothetical protein
MPRVTEPDFRYSSVVTPKTDRVLHKEHIYVFRWVILQNNLVMMAAKRAQEIQDAEDAEREERDAVGDQVGGGEV